MCSIFDLSFSSLSSAACFREFSRTLNSNSKTNYCDSFLDLKTGGPRETHNIIITLHEENSSTHRHLFTPSFHAQLAGGYRIPRTRPPPLPSPSSSFLLHLAQALPAHDHPPRTQTQAPLKYSIPSHPTLSHSISSLSTTSHLTYISPSQILLHFTSPPPPALSTPAPLSAFPLPPSPSPQKKKRKRAILRVRGASTHTSSRTAGVQRPETRIFFPSGGGD